ncbi:MAG: GDP-mannose 4,6-dehydratase [Proteobacteria bacterium]|nr:GDP-mannose 4,6-dehydratase [Pseudomonadota bacterium]MBU1709837.1 GDP-mannose 4,6-dehydratase [Pseudomonadota bacterium]
MNAIIFGANSQDGHYLNELCKLKGIEPIGVSRSGNWIQGDISCYELVERLIKKHLPAYVFHLAANSTTRHDALFENHATISTGTLNVLEAVKRHSPDTKVFITGSGVQFKNTGKPISENDAFEASSPYSVARIQSVYAARYYRSLGVRAYVGYLFHHESPLRKSTHVSKMLTTLAKRISQGANEIIELGDITVEKEWTFAGDIAKGIFTLVEQDAIFEATIGSGEAYSIEQWLELCFKLIDKDWRKYVRQRANFIPEYKRLVSNPATINELGWSPSVKLPELAKMMLNETTQNFS